MADVKDITPDLNKLDTQLDNLEDALGPLLGNLDELSSQLPLLDKAKMFSLIAYAIESLLFSSLKLDGVDAQNHAVFDELKRIQQYFSKIKAIEEPAAQRNTSVNQEAAARILKADLSDNKNISAKLAEKIAEQRAKALLKSVENRKRPAEETSQGEPDATQRGSKKKKKQQQQQQQHKAKGKK